MQTIPSYNEFKFECLLNKKGTKNSQHTSVPQIYINANFKILLELQNT